MTLFWLLRPPCGRHLQKAMTAALDAPARRALFRPRRGGHSNERGNHEQHHSRPRPRFPGHPFPALRQHHALELHHKRRTRRLYRHGRSRWPRRDCRDAALCGHYAEHGFEISRRAGRFGRFRRPEKSTGGFSGQQGPYHSGSAVNPERRRGYAASVISSTPHESQKPPKNRAQSLVKTIFSFLPPHWLSWAISFLRKIHGEAQKQELLLRIGESISEEFHPEYSLGRPCSESAYLFA